MLLMLKVLFLLLLLFSCSPQKKEERATERAVPVSVMPAKAVKVELFYETKGSFKSPKDVRLRPEVSGLVKHIYKREGEHAKKGEPLLKVRDDELRAKVEELKAKLSEALANYEYQKGVVERRKLLYEKELIAREEYERELSKLRALRRQIKALKAALKSAEVQLRKTLLRAPFDGLVADRFVSVGDYVSPQRDAFRYLSLKPIRFSFTLPQEMEGILKEGDEVEVKAEGFGTFKGKVVYLSPFLDESKTYRVELELPNEKGLLKPGAFGVARVPAGETVAFKVPERALVLLGNRKAVWVVEGGRARARKVKVIKVEGGFAFVKGELKEGDLVVVENASALREGVKVKVE